MGGECVTVMWLHRTARAVVWRGRDVEIPFVVGVESRAVTARLVTVTDERTRIIARRFSAPRLRIMSCPLCKPHGAGAFAET
jgi:hypothetical protein